MSRLGSERDIFASDNRRPKHLHSVTVAYYSMSMVSSFSCPPCKFALYAFGSKEQLEELDELDLCKPPIWRKASLPIFSFTIRASFLALSSSALQAVDRHSAMVAHYIWCGESSSSLWNQLQTIALSIRPSPMPLINVAAQRRDCLARAVL
jgi:hypothetical protein